MNRQVPRPATGRNLEPLRRRTPDLKLQNLIRPQVTPTVKPSLPQGTIVEVVTPEGQLNKQTIL